MSDRKILTLKTILAVIAIVLAVSGWLLWPAKSGASNWLFWSALGYVAYSVIFKTFKPLLFHRKSRSIFIGFEIAGVITFGIVVALTTVMLTMFYPYISFLFFGLTLMILSAFIGIRFITFDFRKNMIDGLFADRDASLANMKVTIHPNHDEIEIKTPDREDLLILKKEKFPARAWFQLVEIFQKIGTTAIELRIDD